MKIKTTEKKNVGTCERHLIQKMSKQGETFNIKKFLSKSGKDIYIKKKSRNKGERLNIDNFREELRAKSNFWPLGFIWAEKWKKKEKSSLF